MLLRGGYTGNFTGNYGSGKFVNKTRKALASCGIAYVLAPHLEKTFVDGATNRILPGIAYSGLLKRQGYTPASSLADFNMKKELLAMIFTI
ncbi:MAG: hypothetical protein ACM3X9_01695 [Bacillota bacterium]